MKRLSMMVALGMIASCSRVERQGAPMDPRPTPARETAVEASIISAVVADDCQTAELKAKEKRSLSKADSDGRSMQRACEQSRVQLLVRAGAGDAPARIEVVGVSLHEHESDRVLQDLIARNPQQWSDASAHYEPWDRTVSPSQELRVSFDLSAPDWDAIGNGNRWNTQGMHFRLAVKLRIDGKDRAMDFQISSPFLMREPNVKT